MMSDTAQPTESVYFVDLGMSEGQQYVNVLNTTGDPLEYEISFEEAKAAYFNFEWFDHENTVFDHEIAERQGQQL